MLLLILVLLGLVVLHERVGQACAAIVNAIFDIGASVVAALGGALGASVRWLKTAPVVEPHLVAVTVSLAGAAMAVARADFRVLGQSFELILPSDSGGTEWIAFSMVALTAGAGVLLHFVRRPVHGVGCAMLAFMLIAAQASVAYTRTLQLEEARAVMNTPAPEDAGVLAINGRLPLHASHEANTPTPTAIDRFGPVLSAVIAGLLGAAQLLLTWGVVLLGGPTLAWLVAAPVLALLAAPWLPLRAVFAPQVREHVLSFVTAVFGLFAHLKSALAHLVPAPLTAEAHAARVERRRRAAESKMADFELASTASWRGEVEAELRQAERSGLRDYLAEHVAARRACFRALIEEALRKSPAELAGLPERIVRIWLWPLRKASELACMVGGDPSIKTRTVPAAQSTNHSDLS